MTKKVSLCVPKPKTIIPPFLEAVIQEKQYSSFFKLFLYKNKKIMEKAFSVFNYNYLNKEYAEDEGYDAFVITMPGIETEDPNVIFYSNWFATVFMNMETLTPGVIAHESSHASLSHEKVINRFTGSYSEELEDIELAIWPEERLAYRIEHYVDQITEILEKNNIPFTKGKINVKLKTRFGSDILQKHKLTFCESINN
jgi:hypothetical protein